MPPSQRGSKPVNLFAYNVTTKKWIGVPITFFTNPIQIISEDLDIRNLSALNDSIAAVQSGTWTVTANAGTNLNTSALAVENGGKLETLAGIVTAGRAAVNSIVGQSGVQGGAGAVTASTQRIAIANDANAITAVGTVADDATTPGAPVMIGGSAVETDGTDPTSVSAEADVARVRTDRNRRMLVNTFHPNLWTVTPSAYSSAQTNAEVKAAPGANLSLYITDIFVSNGATAGIITLLDGSGGTVKFRAYCAVNGGAVLNLATPIRLTANTALCITSTTVTTHSVTISGFIAP